MSREQYNPNADLGAFSEWHREALISPYRWIDIDYLGYQIVNGGYNPYVAIERIRLVDEKPTNGPQRYPLEPHKERVYESVSRALDIPSYTMWHTDECRVFVLERIDKDEHTKVVEGHHELMDFFDDLCRSQFGTLSYR